MSYQDKKWMKLSICVVVEIVFLHLTTFRKGITLVTKVLLRQSHARR